MTDEQFTQMMDKLQLIADQQNYMNNLGIWLLSAIFVLAGLLTAISFFVGKGGE
jgi:hypothetical protein